MFVSLIPYCYSLQDPGNLGTLLRSALAFKWVRNALLSQIFCLVHTFHLFFTSTLVCVLCTCFSNNPLVTCILLRPTSVVLKADPSQPNERPWFHRKIPNDNCHKHYPTKGCALLNPIILSSSISCPADHYTQQQDQ